MYTVAAIQQTIRKHIKCNNPKTTRAIQELSDLLYTSDSIKSEGAIRFTVEYYLGTNEELVKELMK